ncbi:hypothetical protein GCM10012275_61820 [Longimycelium tulufanense]|uniref:Uncharacterized protein n=1 Tax=Longimycelium tulufanense TaxID=907463 RepID=A0A8J3CER4_9PSEU|nr:hypothetical protein GCM10012275_61820 [Longimycelium tulufanense]
MLALAVGALVVVHAGVGAVLAVDVPRVQVVDVVVVHDRLVAAAWTVGVLVLLGLPVLGHGGHRGLPGWCGCPGPALARGVGTGNPSTPH